MKMNTLVNCEHCNTKVLKEDLENHQKNCLKNKDKIQCTHCNKSLTKGYIKRHENTCKNKSTQKSPTDSLQDKNKKIKKNRRKSIDPELRKSVWDKYIGKATNSKCFCCRKKEITPFTYNNTFQAGHIISHKHGGPDTIDNLIPICRDCNMNMGEEDWDEYVERHPHLPLRRCGKDPPIEKYIKGIVWMQSLARMYLERKNPNSAWKQEWRKINSKNIEI